MSDQSIEVNSAQEAPAQEQSVLPPKRSTCYRIIDELDERFGLLNTVEYVFDDFGFVDWRSIIPSGFLFINSKKFTDAGKEVPSSMDGLDDSEIIIKLGGIKWLARVRGYDSVAFDVISNDKENVVVKCKIDWMPNFENPLGAFYEEIASCNVKNADDFNLKFAESIAANRAFVRCVRNFLNVNIVGEEELSSDIPSKQSDTPADRVAVDPQSIFLKICKEKGMSLDAILDFCIKNDASLDDQLKGADEKSILKILTPKQAKNLLKIIKKT